MSSEFDATPVKYQGWAPCFHSGDPEKVKTTEEWNKARADWIENICKGTRWWGSVSPTTQMLGGAVPQVDLVENLLWEIALVARAEVKCAADQWVNVSVQGVELCPAWTMSAAQSMAENVECLHEDGDCRKVSTSIQGDDFTVALVETYRWWKERQ